MIVEFLTKIRFLTRVPTLIGGNGIAVCLYTKHLLPCQRFMLDIAKTLACTTIHPLDFDCYWGLLNYRMPRYHKQYP